MTEIWVGSGLWVVSWKLLEIIENIVLAMIELTVIRSMSGSVLKKMIVMQSSTERRGPQNVIADCHKVKKPMMETDNLSFTSEF